VLFQESPDVVLHVVDAKNIKRMLPLTLQLVEAGFPVVLVVNIIDEAERLNIVIDREDLEKTLSIPVVLTSGINGRGLDELKRRLKQGTKSSVPKLRYGNRIETILESINGLDRDFEISRRAVALLLLQGDEEFLREVADRDQTKSKVYRHSGTPAIGPPDRCQMRSIPGLERRLLRGAA
jgi:ferrous iron transport protein B